jgi:tetratricopeptide (TPR) repeat protein
MVKFPAVQAALIAALDDWLYNEPGVAERVWLRAVLARADGDAWRNQVREAISGKDRKALEALAERAEAQRPAMLVLLGHELFRRKAQASAIRLLVRAQERHPGDFWINLTLGSMFADCRPPQPEQAIIYYHVAAALRPDSPGIYYNLGNVLKAKGDLSGAIVAYERAVAINPDYAAAHHNLGIALRDKGDLPAATAAFRKAISANPGIAEAHNALGEVLYRQGDRKGAEAAYRAAIAIKPDHATAQFSLGVVLRLMGDLPGAIAAFEKAATIKPSYAAAYFNLGDILRDSGNLPGAIAAFEKAVASAPNDAKAQFALGEVLQARRDMAGAEVAYQRAVATKPDYAEALLNLGVVLHARSNLAGAEAAYRKAIAVRPDYAEAHNNLGSALSEQGDRPGAEAAYRKAIEIRPDYATAYYGLGNTLSARRDLPGAEAAHRKALAINPDLAEAHCNLGFVLRDEGSLREALASLQRGHDLGKKKRGWSNPSEQWVQDCQRLIGFNEKLPAFLRGDMRPADLTERITLARLCAIKRMHGSASRFYEEAFTSRPDLVEPYKSTGLLYLAACSAVLAGCGKGDDASQLDDKEKARWRRQAIEWLRADLAAWTKQLENNTPQAGAAVQKDVGSWQHDPNLAGLRDAAQLAKLPEAERDTCRKLWAEVAGLLKQAREKTSR